MQRFLLAAGLLLGSLTPALAQRLVSQTASLNTSQRVALELKYAHSIRVRPGDVLRVQARVTINDNQNNDLFSLAMEPSTAEMRVVEKLDEAKLRQTYFEGDCDGGNFHSGSDAVNHGHYVAPKLAGQPKDGQYNYCVRIDYDVTLPAGTSLRVNTISGDLDANGLGGEVAVETISGNVALGNLTAAVNASSVSGNLSLQSLTGPVVAATVSGNVKLTQPGRRPVQATSVSGNVDITWPAAQSAELSLRTTSGEVYADPAVTFSNLKPHSNVGYELHGRYGQSSGPLVKLASTSGDVFFRKQ